MYVGIVCSVLVLLIMFTDMYYIRFTHVHICVVVFVQVFTMLFSYIVDKYYISQMEA